MGRPLVAAALVNGAYVANWDGDMTQDDAVYDELPIALRRTFTMGTFLSSPVAVGGVLYIGSTDGTLYALTTGR